MLRLLLKISPALASLLAVFYCSVQTNARVFYVMTGSMEPLIPTGSFVLSKRIASDSIKVGSVIVFKDASNSKVTAHRVTNIQEDGYVTQGDANTYRDKYLVKVEDIIGVVVAVFPISFGSFNDSILSLLFQIIFCSLLLMLGVTHRKFLIFLRHGFSCPTSTSNPFCRFRFSRRSKEAFCDRAQGSGSR